MSAYGYRALGEHFHRIRQPCAALDFDHIGPRAHHDGGVLEGLFRRGVSHKRQIGEQQAVWRAPAHRAGMVGDIFYGHRQGGVVALYRHAQRIADQHHVDTLIGKQLCKAVVIGGDSGEAFLLLFAFLQQGDSGRFHNVS